ncbi:MAG TPA: exopolysaccharide biosynthesis polyprenyl glycosylphosphotransferase [Egibacteraceae bacterium]|nr:exopolysaccharide biosynthesis polyprenyl glycosylphosphotransferase [Egibacteraceae bacterium]
MRRLLVGLDVGALLMAWAVALVAPRAGQDARTLVAAVLETVGITGMGMALITSQRLYQTRVCAIKVVEHTRLARATLACGVGAWLLGSTTAATVTPLAAAAGTALAFLLLVMLRGGYRAWLRALRCSGQLFRNVVLVGTGPETCRLAQLLHDHPELGFRAAGVVGDDAAARELALDVPYLGGLDRTVTALRESKASGAVVATTCLGLDVLNAVVRQLLAADVHVHLSPGLQGVAHRRLRSQAFAYEPMFYLEQATLGPWEFAAKRVLDVSVAGVALLLALPLLAVAALAIKVHDRGPVIFRQERVGRNGQLFTIYKLRTMVPDAEAMLEPLRARNERHGPLFKLGDDPRVTAVGRVLRKLHVDELPQLLNVLRGTMSLVGPRPALADETELFSDALRARTRILPGMTGLWQVEANDKPEFSAYERLDLFYVENWSIGLDIAILFSTAEVLIVRALSDLREARRRPAAHRPLGLRLSRPGRAPLEGNASKAA